MSLSADGFREGLGRLASTISLNPELPTFLASWKRERDSKPTGGKAAKLTPHF